MIFLIASIPGKAYDNPVGADSLITDEESENFEIDSSEKNENWTFSAYSVFQNKKIQKGIETNNGNPVYSPSLGISYLDAVSLDFDFNKEIGTDNLFENWSVTLGYTYSASDIFDFGIEYSYSDFTYDTTSLFDRASNAIGISIDYMPGRFVLSLSYDRIWGTDAFNYLGLTAIYNLKLSDKFKILPILNFQYSQMTIDVSDKSNKSTFSKLKKLYKNSSFSTLNSLTIEGIATLNFSMKFSYSLFKRFAIFATPSFYYSPMDKSKKNQYYLVFSGGLQYSIDF